MKKVLVLAAAVALFATPAMAVIDGSKHDMTSGAQTAGIVSTAAVSTQICVYCHTPHGSAIPATGTAPLWNRDNLGTFTGGVYNGFTLGTNADAVTSAQIDNTDARLCFSCHAGDNMTQALNNAPNDGNDAVFNGFSTAGLNNLDINDAEGLSDDHPIGFDYALAQAEGATQELNDAATAETAGAKFFGTGTNMMWCSSCHDVHDGGGAGSVQFLRITTANSQICLGCHIK